MCMTVVVDLLKNITNCHFMDRLPLQDELIRDSLGKKRQRVMRRKRKYCGSLGLSVGYITGK